MEIKEEAGTRVNVVKLYETLAKILTDKFGVEITAEVTLNPEYTKQ